MGKTTKSQRVTLGLIVAVTLFIWMQSLLPAVQSLDQSDAVGGWLAALLGDGPVATFLVENVRKVAHFAEFGALGMLWGCFACLRRPRPEGWPLIPGVVTAGIDELLQLTSPGRAAMVEDVLLDTAGYATGWLAVTGVVMLWRFCRKKGLHLRQRRYTIGT